MSEHATIRSIWDDYDQENRRRELSHWRGYGKWEDIDRWEQLGKNTLERLNRLMGCIGRPNLVGGEKYQMLEWGPGGGANALAFKDIASTYYGVDISKKNLDESTRMLEDQGAKNYFRPILLGEDLSIVKAKVKKPLDLFISTAVFQHFPSKAYGLNVLRTISGLCKKDAAGLIHIRFDNGDEEFKPNESIEQYKSNFIRATSFKLDEFWLACTRAGFNVEFLSHVNVKSHFASYFLTKR